MKSMTGTREYGKTRLWIVALACLLAACFAFAATAETLPQDTIVSEQIEITVADDTPVGSMTNDELAVMDGGKCIMQLRGVRPFFSNKYDITKHKRYKYLSDYDSKLAFDIEKYMSRKLVLKKDDPIEVVDIDLSEDELSN